MQFITLMNLKASGPEQKEHSIKREVIMDHMQNN